MTFVRYKPFRYAFLAAACLLLGNSDQAYAVVLAGWEMTGLPGGSNNFGPSPFTPATTDTNVTVGGLTRGSGIGTTGTGAGNAWGGTDFRTTASTVTTAISDTEYATFTVKAKPGDFLSLASIDAYNIRRSGTGPSTGQWQYSTNGTTFTDIGSAITWGGTTTAAGNAQSAITLSGISALQNLPDTTTVTIRVATWGATNTSGTWYLNQLPTAGVNDFTLSGVARGNNSVIDTAVTTLALGRAMQSQTPSDNIGLSKTGTDATAYTAAANNNGITVTPSSDSIGTGSQTPSVSVQLQSNANGSATTGAKTYSVTVDNTATTSNTAGQGSADADNTVNVTATVVADRTVSASSVDLGNVIKGAITSVQASTLTTTGDDDHFTRVTINGTAATNGSVTVAADSAQLFDGVGDTVNRNVSGTFATAGPKSGSVPLSITGEGLTGEAAAAPSVAYTATVYDASQAQFASNAGATLSLDLGTFAAGTGQHSASDAIFNVLQTAGYTAALDFDSISGTGDTSILFTNLTANAFTALAAGIGNAFAFNMVLDANNGPGTYSATYQLKLSDADLYAGAGAPESQTLTLNLSGTITAVPESTFTIAIMLVLGLPVMVLCRRSFA